VESTEPTLEGEARGGLASLRHVAQLRAVNETAGTAAEYPTSRPRQPSPFSLFPTHFPPFPSLRPSHATTTTMSGILKQRKPSTSRAAPPPASPSSGSPSEDEFEDSEEDEWETERSGGGKAGSSKGQYDEDDEASDSEEEIEGVAAYESDQGELMEESDEGVRYRPLFCPQDVIDPPSDSQESAVKRPSPSYPHFLAPLIFLFFLRDRTRPDPVRHGPQGAEAAQQGQAVGEGEGEEPRRRRRRRGARSGKWQEEEWEEG
jgi:hypothetical protein